MKHTILLTAAQAKQLAEQIERKCENCKNHRLVTIGKVSEMKCQKCCRPSEDVFYKNFEQNPITLVFEKGQFVSEVGKLFEITFGGDSHFIPKVGDILDLTCPECGGKGFKYVVYHNKFEGDEECPTCKGKGGWKLKIKASVKFSIVDGSFKQVIRLGKDWIIGDILHEKICAMKLKEGDYVLVEGERCQ